MMRCDLSVRRWLRARSSASVLPEKTTRFFLFRRFGVHSALTDDVPRDLEAFTSVWALRLPADHHSLSVLQIHALQLRNKPVGPFRGAGK